MQSEPTKPADVAGLDPVTAAEVIKARRTLPLDRLLIQTGMTSAVLKAARTTGRLGPLKATREAIKRGR
jgi:hypothetical protein